MTDIWEAPIANQLTFGNVVLFGATMYHSAFTRRSNRGVQTILPSLHTKNRTREFNVVRQHQEPTGKHRPGIEG